MTAFIQINQLLQEYNSNLYHQDPIRHVIEYRTE